MKEYEVTYRVTEIGKITVIEADSLDEARQKAEELLVRDELDHPFGDDPCYRIEVSISKIRLLKVPS